MNFFIFQHQHKAFGIMQALKKERWKFLSRNSDIALFDHYINRRDPEKGNIFIKTYYEMGATILTYPHGATGSWWMDNDKYPPDKRVFGNLVIGEGHKYVEKIIQPYLNHYVIGWSYCPIKEFQKPNQIKNILFAPIHAAIKTNTFREECIDINSKVYNALLNLPNKYTITVRYLNPLQTIGLKPSSRVIFKYAKPDGSYEDIDKADIVIAEGTFMYLSIARGKPTIGMNQHVQIRPNGSDKSFTLKHWDEYGDYMAYPIDFNDSDDIFELFNKAVEKEQTEWKKLFIGNEMNSKELSDLLKEIRIEDLTLRNYFKY